MRNSVVEHLLPSKLAVRRLTLTLPVALPVAAFGWAAWSRRWMSDDGFIYLRVVDQLLAGNGPVFNAGERVEVAASPLWVAMLTLAGALLRPVPLEWIAVALGLLLSLTGLALAAWGALRLVERDRGVPLPLGAAVVVALPPFWDFATSGLETGLGFAWLGGCFWALAREYQLQPSPDRPTMGNTLTLPRSSAWLAVLIGLGPLIRPDFAIFTVAFLAGLFILSPQRSWGQSFRIVAASLALPLAYQIFRMGYYAALVPNPAFAKEASASYWSQGWRYLLDLLQPYWLLVPLLGLASLSWFPSQCQRWKRRDVTGVALAALPIAAGLIYALFITRVGGDFMHGRLLLPALFAVLLPVAVVRLSSPAQLLAALVILPWTIVCFTTLRVPYDGIGPERIADEREYYTGEARHPHPVTLEHYLLFRWAKEGVAARELAAEDSRLLLLAEGFGIGLAPDVTASVVAWRVTIGLYGYAAGTEVFVADSLGLADPIGGRLRLEERSGRPGHEKELDAAWVLARFGEPSFVDLLLADLPEPDFAEAVAAAREALDCDGPKRLVEAVSQPLTGKRFLRNLLESFRLHTLRIPGSPIQAAQELC